MKVSGDAWAKLAPESGPNTFFALQKAEKGLEFNNLTRRLASFWQFSSSKVE